MKLNRFYTLTLIIFIALFTFAPFALAGKKEAPKQVLFKNVNIFNGKDQQALPGNECAGRG